MLEATVALLPNAVLSAALGIPRSETGSDSEIGAAPSGCFRCAGEDDWVVISVTKTEHWSGLCRAMGRADLLSVSEYQDADRRLQAKAGLDEEVASWCRRHMAAEVEALLQAERVPSAKSRGIADLIDDLHIRQRGVFRQLIDGSWTTTLPWTDLDGWRGEFRPTPVIGADNGYVFGEILGLSSREQRRLQEKGVIR
jgi:benzylsuccinate CoA-transferase BbsF subunit